jgi:hypothetical protein
MPVGLIFNPILRGIAGHREQANDCIAAPRLVIDASVREEFHRLTDMEFVVWNVLRHVDQPLNYRKIVQNQPAGEPDAMS